MSLLDLLRPTLRTTRTPYGRVTYLARDVWHGRALARYGEWSEAEVALWRQLVKPGQTAIDVGAHIGCHALALAALVGPLGWVHAFEPQERCAALLDRNVRQNDLRGRVWTWQLALGDGRAGLLRYDVPDYGRPGNFGGVALRPVVGGDRGNTCATAAFDSLNVGRVDFIKIDVEGMEVDVINGMRETIRRDRPIVYAENDRPDRSAQLLRVLGFLRYDVRWHLPPLYNPANRRGDRVNVFGNTVSVNVLALPVERHPRWWPDDPHLHQLERVSLTHDGRIAWR